jgi:hypothetical protein
VKCPVSGKPTAFKGSDKWLDNLASLERFAVRRGHLGFRGWKPKHLPVSGKALNDEDFAPIFEQKGVDMRIGLDIAVLADNRSVDRLLLISGDTDMVPAMKHARKAGLEVVVATIPNSQTLLHNELKVHSDMIRKTNWPNHQEIFDS